MTRLVILLLACIAAFAPNPAFAVVRSITVSPGAMNVYPIYRDDVLVPGLLPKTTDTSFRIGFTLPVDYKQGTNLQVRLMMQANTGTSSSCPAMFGVLYFDRSRPGFPTYETSQPSLDGLAGANTGIVNMPGNAKVMIRVLTVSPPLHGTYTGINAGDNFLIWMKRYATNSLDTCNFVTVYGAEVRYTAAY